MDLAKISKEQFISRIVASVVTSERFFAVMESVNGDTERQYYDLLARVLTYSLRSFGVELVSVHWKGEHLHIYNTKPETTVNRNYVAKIDAFCKLPASLGTINFYEEDEPPNLKGTYIRRPDKNFDLFVRNGTSDSITTAMEICKLSVERINLIRSNYVKVWKYLKQTNDLNYIERLNEGWLRDYSIDRLLCLVICVSLNGAIRPEEMAAVLTRGFMKQISFYPLIHKYKTLYLLRPYQVKYLELEKDLGRVSKQFGKTIQEIFELPYPIESYTPSTIFSGVSWYIEKWEKTVFAEDYPKELAAAESILLDPKQWELYLSPLSEFGENRFMIVLRIRKDDHSSKLDVLQRAIIDEALKIVSKEYKAMFYDLKKDDAILRLSKDPQANLENSVLELKRLVAFGSKDQKAENVTSIREQNLVKSLEGFIEEIRRIQLQVQNHARKAAVAAVMSRNMSHNIGSHVLARLSTSADFTSDVKTLQIACLNSYLRTRMDFLADVSTSVPFIATPKYFYSDVLRYFRPLDGDDPNDDKEHRWPQLLIDRISGEVKVGAEATKLDSQKINLKVKVELDSNNQKEVKPESPLDPVISFPNDALGAHALYTILENMIRNCAKHSKVQDELILTLTVRSANKWGDRFYLLEIVDNLGHINPGRKEKDKGQNNKLLNRLNGYVNTSILDPHTGQLRQGGWGVLEMKVAASYLRRIPPDQIDAELRNQNTNPYFQVRRNGKVTNEPPILQPFLDSQNNLGYRFYLEKPQIALIVSANGNRILLEDQKKEFERLGIAEVRYGDIDLKYGSEHEFIILIDPIDHQINEVKRSNQRYIVLKNNDGIKVGIKEVFQSKDLTSIRRELWKMKVSKLLKSTSLYQGENCNEISPLANHGSDMIFFDHHGKCYKSKKGGEGCGVYDFDNMFYYEPYPTKSPTGLTLERIKLLDGWANVETNENNKNKLDNEKDTFLYELIDCAAAQCAIVDERIQEEAQKYDLQLDTKLSQWVLERMKICVPPKERIDLDKQEFEESDNNQINTWVKETLSNADTRFLVIHLGVIEKMVGTHEATVAKWLSGHEESIKNQDKSIIVISGRGTPSNLPKNTLFLPYSLVARYVLEYRSKFHLCKVLYSARRKL